MMWERRKIINKPGDGDTSRRKLGRMRATRSGQNVGPVASDKKLVAQNLIHARAHGRLRVQQPGDKVLGRAGQRRRHHVLVRRDPVVGLLQRRRLERRLTHKHRIPNEINISLSVFVWELPWQMLDKKTIQSLFFLSTHEKSQRDFNCQHMAPVSRSTNPS